MKQVNAQVSPELMADINDVVRCHGYTTVSELVREALRDKIVSIRKTAEEAEKEKDARR